MINWIFYTVPPIFCPIYIRNLIANLSIFVFITMLVFGVIPGSGSIFLLWLMTDISFYAAMKRIDDDHS